MNRKPGALEARMKADAVAALKQGDKRRRLALSTLLAALKKERIDAGSEAPDEADELVVLKRERKRRLEALGLYEKGGRAELAEQARYESDLLGPYMPQELSTDELATLVNDAIRESGATLPKEMGKVMALLMPRVAGRADGKVASDLVRSRLGA